MADITTPSNWEFQGRPVYREFQEVILRDSSGNQTGQQKQVRNVYTFRRRRIEPAVWIGGTLPDTDLGQVADAATLSAYIGSYEIDAGSIHTGESQKYECVLDEHQFDSTGADWVWREQQWEMRGDYADYTWPTTATV